MSVHTGPRVMLRPVSGADRAEFTALARASSALHRRWVSVPTTPERFASYVAEFDGVTSVGLLVCLRGSGAIAGFVSIRQIQRESFQRGVLGYGAFVPHHGRGYMHEGLVLALRHAFGELGLRRLEADIQPGNAASLRLAEKLGFRREGFSPGLIKIGGTWRDHERWAVTTDMIESPPATFSDLDNAR